MLNECYRSFRCGTLDQDWTWGNFFFPWYDGPDADKTPDAFADPEYKVYQTSVMYICYLKATPPPVAVVANT